MLGLAFLAIIATYVVLNIILIRYLWKRLSKQAAVICTLIILSLPLVDEVIGKQVLKRSCEDGITVITQRVIPNVDKIFLSDGVSEDSPSHYGYKITEELGYYKNLGYIQKGFEIVQKPKLLVRRATMSDDSKIAILEEKMEPIANYGLRVQSGKTFWLDVERYTTVNRIGTEELGSFYWYSFRGGWAVRFFTLGMGSSSISCGNSEGMNQKRIELLHATIKPA